MSKTVKISYLDSICSEFKLLNIFIKDLNSKVSNGGNENYTVLYDECVENTYNDWNIQKINNGKDEKEIDEKFIDYLIQNVVLNIKTFLRNNYLMIDDKIEKLCNLNKKLKEKLKAGLDEAELQESYIDELESDLKYEKEKNKHMDSLIEKVKELTLEKEHLMHDNEQLELLSLKQKEENMRMKKELTKYTQLYEQNKEYKDKYLCTNILNNEMNNLLKKMRYDVHQCNKKNRMSEVSRSYSLDFVNTVHDFILQTEGSTKDKSSKESMSSNTLTNSRKLYRSCLDFYEEKENYQKVRRKLERKRYLREDKFSDSEQGCCISNRTELEPTSHDINNMSTNSELFITRKDSFNPDQPTEYRIYSSGSLTKSDETDSIYKQIDLFNRQLSSDRENYEHAMQNRMLNDIKLKNMNNLQSPYLVNRSACTDNSLLVDIKNTLRNSQIDFISCVVKNHIDKVEKKMVRESKMNQVKKMIIIAYNTILTVILVYLCLRIKI